MGYQASKSSSTEVMILRRNSKAPALLKFPSFDTAPCGISNRTVSGDELTFKSRS